MPKKAAKPTAEVAKKSATKSVKKSEVVAPQPAAELKAAPKPAVRKPAVRKRVAKPKPAVAVSPAANASTPAYEDIARLAYELWERRGRPDGSEQEDWFHAERALAQ